MGKCYSGESEAEERWREWAGGRFVDMVATMGRVNTVRVYYEQRENRVGERVAKSAVRHVRQYL